MNFIVFGKFVHFCGIGPGKLLIAVFRLHVRENPGLETAYLRGCQGTECRSAGGIADFAAGRLGRSDEYPVGARQE